MLEKGTTIAGYRIDGVLGRGGMGVVYEATQLTLKRTVALKLLAADVSDDVVFHERFRREGQIQAAIDHPHIVTVYEAGESEYGLFLAMRVVRGPNLKDMAVSRELDAGRTLRILTPIADALDAAHAAGLIHRDMKPQNILVGGRDHAFLADFGLTKAAGERSLTKTGQFVGTLDYISPEQIRGEPATAQSDIYALAAVLYECLTGVVPYPKESEAAVLYAHMSDPPPRPTEERPELPAELDEVLEKAMAKDPRERHTLAVDLLRDAERAFGKTARAAFSPPGPIEVPEETGIRPAESTVRTKEAAAPEAGVPHAPAEPTRRTDVPTEKAPERATEELPEPAVTVPGIVAPTRPGETTAAPPRTVEAPTEAGPPARAETAAGTTQQEPTPRTPRRMSPATLGGLGALLLALIAAGFLIGRSGSGETAPAAENLASAGSLELSFPSGWKRSDERPEIPGLKFADPIAIEPIARTGGGTLVAGRVTAAGPTLLPAAFLERLDDPPPRDDAVRLGELEAYRYRNLSPEGFDRRLTLYVVPTTEGVATVACMPDEGSQATFLRECQRVAVSLKLTDAEAFELGPNARYAKTLDDAITMLNSARRSGLRRLGRARTPAAQARVAGRLVRAYRSAVRVLGRARVSPADREANATLVSALERTEGGYRQLAAGARRGDRRRYDVARRAVRRREARVRTALRALERHGYEVK